MSYGTSYVIRNSKSVISNDSILFPNLTLLKEHLNIVDSDFNNILEQYREMSIAEFLGYNGKTGLSIIKSEHVVDFNGFPQCSERVSLPNPPTKVVNSFFITYFDGYVQPVDISNFIINYSSEPTFLFPIIDWKSIITYNDSTPRFFTIKISSILRFCDFPPEIIISLLSFSKTYALHGSFNKFSTRLLTNFEIAASSALSFNEASYPACDPDPKTVPTSEKASPLPSSAYITCPVFMLISLTFTFAFAVCFFVLENTPVLLVFFLPNSDTEPTII